MYSTPKIKGTCTLLYIVHVHNMYMYMHMPIMCIHVHVPSHPMYVPNIIIIDFIYTCTHHNRRNNLHYTYTYMYMYTVYIYITQSNVPV